MTTTETGTTRRLGRLERLLAGRRARLAHAIVRQQRRTADRGPMRSLQRYGYPLALALVVTAVLPKAVGFALRRRKLLFGAFANGLALWTLRKRSDSVRHTGSGR